MRNVPPDPDESVSEHVEHFFCVNHPDNYLTHQVQSKVIYQNSLRKAAVHMLEMLENEGQMT